MKEENQTFEEVVKPLMEWLDSNHHPHCTIIINNRQAELVEGKESFVLDYDN